MRILIVHNKYKQLGGEDTVVEQEFNAYTELGYTVKTYFEDNKDLTLFDILFSLFNIKSALKFKKIIAEFNPDIIHFHNIIFKLSPSVFWVIPKGIKVFLTIHNYRFLCPSGTLFFNGKINHDSKTTKGLIKNMYRGVYQDSTLKTFLLTLVFRLNLLIGTFKRIDEYIFLTEFSKKIHQQWFKKHFNNALIKPNFLIDQNQNKAVKTIDLIFIGRFTEEKGLPEIINVLQKFNELQIHLVGNGPLFTEIKRNCKNFEHIKVHGNLSRERTLKLLSQSKFLLFPSVWYEGMPMTIIEAFSCGVPVICRKIGAMSSMITDNKTGVHYNSINDFETKITFLNKLNYTSMSSLAYKTFENKYSTSIALSNLKKLVGDKNY